MNAKDTVVIARLETEKLRSRKRLSGTSGSLRLRACHHTKSASTTSPATISRHTVIGPVMVDQSYCSPSWMPKTSRNMPTPLSATPSQSKRWWLVSRLGTRRHASTNATIPTGTLTKKIHSQPRPSTSTPPAIGPTSVATPATAPQSAIAEPRRAAGNTRVMTAIVCGVIIDAPRPWATRATISPSMVVVSPQASEAPVKTTRPTR